MSPLLLTFIYRYISLMFTVLCTKIEGLDTYCFTAWKSCIQANSTVINISAWSSGFFKLCFLSPQLYFCGVVALLASLKIRTICTTIVSLQPITEAGKTLIAGLVDVEGRERTGRVLSSSKCILTDLANRAFYIL